MVDKIVEFLAYPVEVLLQLTCYAGEKDDYERGMTYVVSICGTFFLGWTFNQ